MRYALASILALIPLTQAVAQDSNWTVQNDRKWFCIEEQSTGFGFGSDEGWTPRHFKRTSHNSTRWVFQSVTMKSKTSGEIKTVNTLKGIMEIYEKDTLKPIQHNLPFHCSRINSGENTFNCVSTHETIKTSLVFSFNDETRKFTKVNIGSHTDSDDTKKEFSRAMDLITIGKCSAL